ncbi:MAG: ADP-ribosylglycohydrolase family protein [Actinomycetia bacterium]|nr:ADP-ribosylglycohydrolase family protein [Actinomycetes bacterium]
MAGGSFKHREPPADQRRLPCRPAVTGGRCGRFGNPGRCRDGALLAANLAGDADTAIAVYGQIAGAYYGAEAIPPDGRNSPSLALPPNPPRRRLRNTICLGGDRSVGEARGRVDVPGPIVFAAAPAFSAVFGLVPRPAVPGTRSGAGAYRFLLPGDVFALERMVALLVWASPLWLVQLEDKPSSIQEIPTAQAAVKPPEGGSSPSSERLRQSPLE